MALTDAERKRNERVRKKHRDQILGMANLTMRLSAIERSVIAEQAKEKGFTDQTEYLLSLVYKDRDMSQKEKSE
ncbi:hypothetical protein GCM10011533_30000 [Streptosporangium jomthongense]|uniref:Uncharacterized protein n=1 Tax=Marinobacter aromaticivorans TaxID=1494078 RepID=A0ABW2IYU3_9GAMM|nr:hypothetical protein [Marinobacter aromaticivorans]GGE75654.1 hypothetical protein GCM10011533_30000 [Streptosporangium jomthongense]